MNSNRVDVSGWKVTQRIIRVRVGPGLTERNLAEARLIRY